ncbi:MAG: acetyl-CoA C-acyltransferase [Gemmatimonadota bacterium]
MTAHSQAYVLPGLRSPFCKVDRELASLDALEISVPVVQQTVAGDTGLGPANSGRVDLILWGSVIPSLAVSNWAREVWLDSGLDPHVPAQTVIQACGTSLAAATHAAAQARDGHLALALCGGVESITFTQVGLTKGLSRTIRRSAGAGSPGRLIRTLAQLRLADLKISVPGINERTTGKSMGQHCEEMARRWEIRREEQDRLALDSHTRSTEAPDGFFRRLLVSPGTFPVDNDTIPRSDTSLEKLARLKPAFDPEHGTLTAGNSSPLTDGAAACWVASPEGLRRLPQHLPRALLVDWEQAAIDPRSEGLLMAPALAVPRLLARHNLTYGDIGLWEIHEAFAAQVLCTLRALEEPRWLRDKARVDADLGPFPREGLNPNGGSVAIGHPFAATGARILSQTVVELADRPPGTRAVVSICTAGGLGHVALLEAV